jgi:phosphoserine phosphatase
MDVYHGLVAAFDVDETLVIWRGDTYSLNEAVAEQLRRHHNRGHTVVVWSAGGAVWATQVVRQYNLEKYVHLIIAKPTWMWDDLPPSRIVAHENWCWRGGKGDSF